MPSRDYAFELVRDPQALQALESEWDALHARADRPYLCQSFGWNWCSWETQAEPYGARLHCLVARLDGRVVLIWPMVVRSHWRLWSIARPLGSLSTEYATVLIDSAHEDGDLLARAWQHMRATCPSDLIRISRVRADSPLHRLLVGDGSIVLSTHPAPYLDFGGREDWNGLYLSLSKNLRRDDSQQLRRLVERGGVSFEVVTEGERYDEVLDWLIRGKRASLAAKGVHKTHMDADSYHEFLKALPRQRLTNGRVVIFALCLDDKVIAADFVSIDGTRAEVFIRTYDLGFSSYSPGTLLQMACLRWAHWHGCTIWDFRIGDEDYKRRWANNDCLVSTHEFAGSHLGRAFIRLSALASLAAATARRRLSGLKKVPQLARAAGR
jgi:CelD/BcsL family acetyltransferase involved in cellulose biosynthesis